MASLRRFRRLRPLDVRPERLHHHLLQLRVLPDGTPQVLGDARHRRVVAPLRREQRLDHEKFIDTVDRIGVDPFKKRVYEKEQ